MNCEQPKLRYVDEKCVFLLIVINYSVSDNTNLNIFFTNIYLSHTLTLDNKLFNTWLYDKYI